MESNGRDRALLVIVGLALVGSLAYMLVRALGGASRLVDRDVLGLGEAGDTFAALPWLIVASIAALAALAGWAWASARAASADAAEGARDEARREAEAARAEASEQRERTAELESEKRNYDAEIDRLRRSQEDQRRYSRELASELNELQRKEGSLGGRDDVRSLVLRVAISLLDAEKGLLLSRRDEDHDGNLDVVAHEGFESDPERSALVQRFGDEVIQQDQIVRIGRDEMPADHAVPADGEIDNLVAIPIYIADEFHGVVVCANGASLEHDDEVLVALGDHAGAILENSRLHGELRGSYLATVKMLADAIEVKDPFLRGHSDEVSGLVRAMAKRLEMTDDRREQLIFGSLLHDIGKLGVSERILLKPGPLTDEEFSAVKLHPRIGYRLVAQVPLLLPVAPAILHHHERWDGTGYPSGLAGERIPLEARVIAIIDAFSAMISDRPYQEAVPVEAALQELERCAGSHFDANLVAIFVEEVRAGIPADDAPGLTLAEALDDPELHAMRGAANGSIGMGMFSSTDSLTLLHSHSYFRERLRAAIAQVGLAESSDDDLALVVVKVANLGDLNRELGYAGADRLLEKLARQIERAAVDCGGIAGRDDGSRMAVLAPGLDAEGAESLARGIEGRCPEGLQIITAPVAWVEGATAESMLDGAVLRLGERSEQESVSPGSTQGPPPAPA